jgi:glutamate/tyrosine decarboxylase-like PLP-dependent enzyme
MSRSLADLRAACASPLPHPDAAGMETIGRETLAWVVQHLATLPEQPIGLSATRAEMEAMLRRPLEESGRPFVDVLADFAGKVAPYAFRTNHPRFLAFIPAAPTVYSVLGDFLCAACNFFAGVWLEASGPAQVELIVLDWFKQLLGLPKEAGGLLTSGGSEANLTALVAAREMLSWEQRGRAVLYVAEQRHWSIDRAARIIGLHPSQVRALPADVDFRLIPDVLTAAIAEDRAAGKHPWTAVANGGATNSGAVDPLNSLAEMCQRERIWLHVDAAYGWPAVLTEAGRANLSGIERADSLTLDPHKWLAQTYEAGCVLVRDGSRLPAAFAIRPEYMQDVEPGEDEVNFCDLGLALTRRFKALKVWLSLQVLGIGWYRRLVERCFQLAELSQHLLEETGCFEMLSRQLSIVCFRHVPAGMLPERLDGWNLALVESLRKTGRVFLSSTRLRGQVYLRFCFVNWRTTTADVEEAIGLLRSLAGHNSP